MRIAQLSDTHVSTPGTDQEDLLRTMAYAERAVAHVRALAPDVVLITGDLVERGEGAEYARFREVFDALPMPWFVIPGNHDARPTMARAFADRGYLPQDGGFLQYVVEEWPVRLVALDTLVPGSASGEVCADRLRWLDERLREAPERPTIVFLHHPPFATGIAAMDAMGLAGREALAAVIRRHAQVERVLCGHVHRPITRRWAGTVASVAPSTAHQVALALPPSAELAIAFEPAACAVHEWLGDDGLVTHLSPIEPPRPRLVLHDGRRWLGDEAIVPEGFQPLAAPPRR